MPTQGRSLEALLQSPPRYKSDEFYIGAGGILLLLDALFASEMVDHSYMGNMALFWRGSIVSAILYFTLMQGGACFSSPIPSMAL